MFILKKILASIFTIPGIIILFLLISGLYGFKKKIRLLQLNFIVGIILYLLSISPVSNFIIGAVEENHFYDGSAGADAIILLGGGVIEGVDDFSGNGIPSEDMLYRVVDAARLYSKYGLPVIVSGGAVGCNERESEIAKRFLIDLNVPERKIITEGESRDTIENAMYVKKIFIERGFKKGLLVSSAYHIKRAGLIFRNVGPGVIPYSSGIFSGKKDCFEVFDVLPHINNLRHSAIGLKEIIGLAYCYIKYEAF